MTLPPHQTFSACAAPQMVVDCLLHCPDHWGDPCYLWPVESPSGQALQKAWAGCMGRAASAAWLALACLGAALNLRCMYLSPKLSFDRKFAQGL